jgi:peptidoglycan/LPS O-acetylase OafA/YrhL
MLNTKQRFDVLDGLRGVAALLVVIYHITEGYAEGPLTHMPNHG